MSEPDPRTRSSMARLPGPEVVATGLAVLIAAILGASALAGGPGGPGDGPSPSPTASATFVVPSPTSPVDANVVDLLRALNRQLVDGAVSLTKELARASLRTTDVVAIMRRLSATILLATDKVGVLGGAQGPDEVGGRLTALYRSMSDVTTQTLGASNTNEDAYRLGASALVALIERLPALQAELDALASGPPPSVSEPPSVAPSPSASPAATTAPTPTPPPSSSAPPTVAPSVAPDEQIVSGGFEAGVGLPWLLLVAPGSAATIAADTAGPGSGTTSARIDIAVGGPAYAGISLQQAGLALEAGARYTVALSARATVARDLRIRVTSRDDASYLTRIAPVGAVWSVVSFTFIAPVSDGDALLVIDLGRSDVTTWLDSVSFRPVSSVPAAPL